MGINKIHQRPELDQAIQTLTQAVESLDSLIKIMQDSQKTLRSWLEPGQEIGWIETND